MRPRQTVAILALAVTLGTPLACSSNGNAPEAGSATSTTKAGASPTTAATATAKLPDSWPAELALPANTTVLSSAKTSADSMTAVARIDGDTEAVYNQLKTQLTDAGYEIVGSTFTPSDKGGFGSISAKGKTATAAIAFGPDPTGKTSQVTLNVAKLGT